MNTYGTRNTTIVRGEGPYLFDQQGRRYLDAISGIAVCGLGYSHPAVTEAICTQANTLLHCSNLYLIEPQVQLGEALRAASGMDKVFFSNSGAEANEAAIKIARKFGQSKDIASPEIITCNQSFHGRTMATLTATGNPKVKEGFAPLLSGFKHAAFNSIPSILEHATDSTVAIMVEPVQGEGGVRIPAESYLEELRALCDKRGWLLILDEIQTGNGRTGRYFAYQHSTIMPDIVTTAKGLGNGVPIGACLARGDAANILQPGNHGSTFGGNPLACQAALAVVKNINNEDMLKKVEYISNRLSTQLRSALATQKGIIEVRSKGLMIGIELDKPCTELVELGKEKGLLINVTCGNVVRLLPPFILNDEQIDELANGVIELINTALLVQKQES